MPSQYSIINNAKAFYALASPKQRLGFWWLCLLNVFMGLFEMGVAGAVSFLGVALASPETLTKIAVLQRLVQMTVFSGYPETLQMVFLTLIGLLFLIIAKNSLLAYIIRRQNAFGQEIGWTRSTTLFHRYLNAPYLWHTKKNSAELLAVIDWRDYAIGFVVCLMTLFTQGAIALFLLCGAMAVNAKASVFLFFTTACIAIVIQKFIKKNALSLSQSLYTMRLRCAKTAMQALHGIREVIIYDQKRSFSEEYGEQVPAFVRQASMLAILPNVPQWILESTGIALLLVVFAYEVVTGATIASAIASLMMLTAVSWRLLPAANKITAAAITLRREQAGVEPLLEAFAQTEQCAQPEMRAVRPFEREFALRDIVFTYPGATKPAVHDVSITISKKQSVGFIGLSGSAKTTLSGIIAGLLVPEQGELLVDGYPLNPHQERLRLGYVPQNLYLLDASLAENVAFSCRGEPINESRVRQCCRMAAMDFIGELSDGIYTQLGERGVRLSGGQIQRVGIARALYDNPDILIFDEATSALDGATENAIQATIYGLQGSATLLIIAHRLSTVAGCDIVHWVNNGTIIASGPPDEVLPKYEHMLRTSRHTYKEQE